MVAIRSLLTLSTLALSSAAQNTPIRYMPFGDSITEIVCWRGLLYTQLQAAGYTNVNFVGSGKNQNSAGCKTTTYDRDNEGHSGFQAVNIANQNQLVGWLNSNPADLITMHLGTNDVNNGKSTNDIIASFTKLVQQMRASNPRMKIIVAKIIPISFGSVNNQIIALNNAIPAWATAQNSTTSPIWVVDQYTGFSTSDLRDGVHPNEAGDTKMAAKWYPAVVNAIKLIQAGAKREVEFES